MTYPRGYEWLGTLGLLPLVISEWLKINGTREVIGSGNNPVIMNWAKTLEGAGILKRGEYYADSVPWCGLGMAIVCYRAGKPVQEGPLWAQNWARYGKEVARNVGSLANPRLQFAEGQQAVLGDTLVFVRDGGGHVGSYVAEDPTAYHVFGANQSDAVSIVRVAKTRCIAVRRPPFKTALPASAKPYHVAATGALSRNEA